MQAPAADPSSPLRIPAYRRFFAAKLAATLAGTIMVVVVGWQVYDIARLTMSVGRAGFWLGMVGLAQFVPVVLLTPVVGWAADRLDRRHIVRAALALELVCALALTAFSATGSRELAALFAIAALLGVARAFASPALTALAPNLVPRALLPRAIALNSIGWQVGSIAGPPLGGALYAWAPATPYATAAGAVLVALIAMLMIPSVPRPPASDEPALQQIRAGLGYVRANKVVLGAITLDLFAVILSGATALLPVYARDILNAGPQGLGVLRAAPAAGAALVALWLAKRSLGGRVGAKMFAAVVLFGLATVVFGLSRTLWLSVAALAVAGAADMVSVYVRQTLVQIHTPDSLRGRVAAVSSLAIGASNELGEARAGLAVAAVGPVAAAAGGGALAVLVALLWAAWFPALRRADRLEGDAAPR